MTPYEHSTAAARRMLILPVCAFVLSAMLLPWVGAGPISLAKVMHREPPDYEILVQLRITRTLLALVAGGALSLAGSLFQAMLRDALATPYTLGISAGASLGAVAVIAAGWQMVWGIPATWIGALAGAFGVLVLVLGGCSKHRQISAFSLLLTGIADKQCLRGMHHHPGRLCRHVENILDRSLADRQRRFHQLHVARCVGLSSCCFLLPWFSPKRVVGTYSRWATSGRLQGVLAFLLC